MNFPFLKRKIDPTRLHEWVMISLLIFLAFAVLWKGGKSLESTWLLIGIASVSLWSYWYSRSQQVPYIALLWGVSILFVLWTALSFLTSSTQNYGLDEVFRTVSLVLLFHWAFRERDNAQFWDRFVLVLVGSVLLAGIIGTFVYIFQPVSRHVGSFFDYRFHTDYWPNAWAQLLLLSWPFLIGLLSIDRWKKRIPSHIPIEQLHKAWRGFVILLMGLFIAFLFLSYSRGALIAAIGQAGLLGILSFKRVSFKKLIAPLCSVLILASLCFYGVNTVRSEFFAIESVADKATFQAAEGVSSASERQDFWKQSFALSTQKPLTGWGPYSFRFVQPRSQTSILATSDHPHNVFLKYASERGWPAVIFFVALLGIITVQVFRSRSALQDPILLSSIVGILGVLAHNLIDYNLQFVGIAFPFWMLLGLLAGSVFNAELTVPSQKFKLFFVRGVELLLVVFFLSLAVLEAKELVLSSFGRHAEARGDIHAALDWYESSQNQIFSRDMHLSRTQLLLAVDNPEAAKDILNEYFMVNGEDARAWKLRGDIERRKGNKDAAIKAYEHSFVLSPQNDIAALNALVHTLIEHRDMKSLEEREQGLQNILSDYTEAIEHNVHFIALSENVEHVTDLANTLARMFPQHDPFYTVIAARAVHHSRVERERLSSRPPGYLW